MAQNLIEIGTLVTTEIKMDTDGEFIFEEIYGTYQGFLYTEHGIIHEILESITGELKQVPPGHTIYMMEPVDIQGIQEYATTLLIPMNQLDTLLI